MEYQSSADRSALLCFGFAPMKTGTGAEAAPYTTYVGIYGMYCTAMWLGLYYIGRKDVLGQPYIFLPSLISTFGLLRYLGRLHGDDYHTPFDMFCLFLVGWCWCSVLAFLGKTFFLRLRPAARIADDVAKDENSSDSIQKRNKQGVFASDRASFSLMHSEGKNREHSFPSFDAACAGCLVATTWVAEFTYLLRVGLKDRPQDTDTTWHDGLLDVFVTSLFNVPAVLWLGLLFAMYGRVYFLAHHVLDVVCGAAMGFAVTAFAGLAFRPEITSGVWHLGSFFGRQVGPQEAFTTPLALGERNIVYRSLHHVFASSELPSHPTGFSLELVWTIVCVVGILSFFFVKILVLLCQWRCWPL